MTHYFAGPIFQPGELEKIIGVGLLITFAVTFAIMLIYELFGKSDKHLSIVKKIRKSLMAGFVVVAAVVMEILF